MNETRFLPESIRRDLHWVSAFSRLSIGSLFLSAGILKLPGGVSGTIAYYSSLFENSLLPAFLVRAHASVILFAELALGIWLLTGYRLAMAWKVAAALLTSLAIGMLFAGKYDVASDNYVYVLLSLGGLLVSRYDRWALGTVAAGDSLGATGFSLAPCPGSGQYRGHGNRSRTHGSRVGAAERAAARRRNLVARAAPRSAPGAHRHRGRGRGGRLILQRG
jgi:hypothetical protein